MGILYPILVLGGLGFLFGIGLSLAARKFCVSSDPRIEKIQENLPGANCGACGLAGCSGLAEALVEGKSEVDQCTVAQDAEKSVIAKILGLEFKSKEKRIAFVHCNGGLKVLDKFYYRGIKNCAAANLVLGGQKNCIYGCLGFGDCVKVCPFEAIIISEEGLPVIDKNKCKACNKCVLVCPKKIITLDSVKKKIFVCCSSHDTGKDTRIACPVGCIACRICEKACKFDAIHVVGNVAVIDYNKCTLCGECVKACPRKIIKKYG